MAKINFYLRGQNELSNIYVQVLDGRKANIRLNTGFVIEKSNWNNSKNEVIEIEDVKKPQTKVIRPLSEDEENTELNRRKKLIDVRDSLEKLHRDITDELRTAKANSIDLNREWLETVILKSKGLYKESSLFFYDVINDYKERITGKVKDGTLKNFNTTMQRLKRFEEIKKKRYHVKEIDLTFHSDYEKIARTKLNLSINSIGKDIKQFKTVLLDAKDRGIEINEQAQSRKFKAETEKTLFVTLDEQEIERIKNFKGADYLENAKDWLIIGCWTGCRVGDLMKLSVKNIQTTVKGQKFIRYTQSKTGKQVDIPLHNDVKEIIERLGDFPRPISDQKFNDYIKLVCKSDSVNLNQIVYGTRQNPKTHLKETGNFEKWQLVRSHICRRSFATNHYNKLPNKLIMAVTGHATEKMLLNYIGETENDHIDDFLSVWNNSNKKDEQVVQMSKKSV
jgi:integrase